ncbi:hypothetical protein VP277E431_P0217 [Vibrio phage 277E43-1]|nr:hypothetical protein VP277E431_P0217 [Vibrio phage 277E43-1]
MRRTSKRVLGGVIVESLNYTERREEAIGKYLMYNGYDNKEYLPNEYQPISTSEMKGCIFRKVNTGENYLTLVETDYKGTYSFHFKNILATDIYVGFQLDILLSRRSSWKSKYKAFKGLRKFWFSEE